MGPAGTAQPRACSLRAAREDAEAFGSPVFKWSGTLECDGETFRATTNHTIASLGEGHLLTKLVAQVLASWCR